jgi:hypothetical protein
LNVLNCALRGVGYRPLAEVLGATGWGLPFALARVGEGLHYPVPAKESGSETSRKVQQGAHRESIVGDETWDAAYEEAGGGTIELIAIGSTNVSGTFHLDFSSGDRLTGSFSAPVCPQWPIRTSSACNDQIGAIGVQRGSFAATRRKRHGSPSLWKARWDRLVLLLAADFRALGWRRSLVRCEYTICSCPGRFGPMMRATGVLFQVPLAST